MEFFVCMLLASLLTGGRIGVDVLHALRGTTPPHVEKARLSTEKARLKAQQAGAGGRTGGRSRYAEGKPRARDVAAVYWGDALADVIDAHNRRREEKKNPQPSAEGTKGPSLLRQVADLLVRPVGEPKPADDVAPPEVPPVEKVPTWECASCHLDFTGPRPAEGMCIPCAQASRPDEPQQPDEQPDVGPSADSRGRTCPHCGQTLLPDDGDWVHPGGGPCPAAPGQRRRYGWECSYCGTERRGFVSADASRADAASTWCPPRNEYHGSASRPSDAPATAGEHTTEGDPMTQPSNQSANSTNGATGDAHDLESASQQCDLLDDDLTAINTALDLIDEKIDSAGTATELIEAFLKSKNMPETAVGGMSVARDMLSPTHIKALMDAIAAAKLGVRGSKEALDTMNDQASEALQGADGSVVNGR